MIFAILVFFMIVVVFSVKDSELICLHILIEVFYSGSTNAEIRCNLDLEM